MKPSEFVGRQEMCDATPNTVVQMKSANKSESWSISRPVMNTLRGSLGCVSGFDGRSITVSNLLLLFRGKPLIAL